MADRPEETNVPVKKRICKVENLLNEPLSSTTELKGSVSVFFTVLRYLVILTSELGRLSKVTSIRDQITLK